MNEWLLVLVFSLLLLLAATIAAFPCKGKAQLSIALIVIVGSIIGYWQWGAWKNLTHYYHQKNLEKQAQLVLKTVKGPSELIDKLKQHLDANPNAARGWFLLGRLYASQGEWALSFQAFTQAHQLKPHNEKFYVNYAQSMWQVNGQKFNLDIRNHYQRILKDNPKQADTLSMLAIDAFQEKSYQTAIDYWTRLLPLVPPDSADSAAIRRAIAKAQSFETIHHVSP